MTYHLPKDWEAIPCCDACSNELSAGARKSLDDVLDRACIQGAQKMSDIRRQVATVLTGIDKPVSFFSEEGETVDKIINSGLQWRAAFDKEMRMDEMVDRMVEIRPGATLRPPRPGEIEAYREKIRREFRADEAKDPHGECRFCCWHDQEQPE